MYDVCIIGAGIIGCFLAHGLSGRELRVLLLEKEADVANGATMANSAIIHAGNDPEDGTRKADLNVRGSRDYEGICRDLGVSYIRTSALVAATSPEEEQTLAVRYKRALARGIPARLLTREEAIRLEPNLSDRVTQAVELPTTAIICPWEVTCALAEEAVLNGTDLCLDTEVTGIAGMDPEAGDGAYFTISASRFDPIRRVSDPVSFAAKCVVNCAGLYADRVYAMVSGKRPLPFSITPRRGEYFVIDKLKEPVVGRIIYPVPSSAGKGVLAVPTVDGNLLVGPNAQNIADLRGVNTTREGLDFVSQKISATVKNIPMQKVIRQFAGLRSAGNGGDFLIEEAEDVRGFVNVACIDSPGISAAPAIAGYVMDSILSRYFSMDRKSEYVRRRPQTRMDRMEPAERETLAASDPAFARVICRCEQITEGEILDVIRRPVGARTVRGVKMRARPGMGRCQGGFCEPRVVEILARELGISKTDVRYGGGESFLLTGETKDSQPGKEPL